MTKWLVPALKHHSSLERLMILRYQNIKR